MMDKIDRKLLKNGEEITSELQHNLVVVDVDNKRKKKTELKQESQKLNVANLRDETCGQLVECRIKGIMSGNHIDS